MSNSASHRLTYQPALDGIRGLAVCAVLAYHAGLPWARGGFLGVDAFFVLSGYLITSLLLTERAATGSINLLAFWTRRARRLLPALFLVFAGVIGYAAIFAEPGQLDALRQDAFATLGYVANWRAALAGQSYFDQFAAPSPLRHTWSLAIEEQWYLIWPIVLIFLLRARRLPLQTVGTVALAMAAGSALLMAWLHDPHGDPSRVYYGTDTRAQALLVGAVLAASPLGHARASMGKGERVLQVAALGCAAWVGWMWVRTSGDSIFLYRGGFLLLAIAVAVVIASVARTARGPLGPLLSLPPLRGLGLISYGVYLWHWPLYLVLTPERTGWDGYGLFAARVLVTIAVAIASYRLIEAPFRRGAVPRWRVSWALAPAAAVVLVVGVMLATRGEGTTFSTNTSSSPPAASSTLAGPAAPRPARVLVVGDSVSLTMGLGLGNAAPAWNLSVWNTGRLGCGVLRADALRAEGRWVEQEGSCNDWPARWQSYVAVFQPDVAVVLAGAWDLFDRRYDGQVLEFGTPEADTFVLEELELAVDVLSARGAKVMVLTTPYFQQRDLGLDVGSPRFDHARIDRLNALYKTLAERRPSDVLVLDLNAFVGAAGNDSLIEMQNDGVHFAPEGANVVGQWLAPQIVETAHAAQSYTSTPALDLVAGAGELPPPRWAELLEHVPDSAETRSLTVMNDYGRYRGAFNVHRPEADASDAALFSYYRSLLFGPAGELTGLAPAEATGITTFPPRLAETRTRFGFTIADIDQDIWAGQASDLIQVLLGRFDPARTYDPLHANSQSGLIYLVGNHIYLSTTTKGHDGLIQTAAGPRAALSEDPDFRLLAQALEGLNTYTAAFSADVESYTVADLGRRLAGADADAEGIASARASLEQETKLLPYQAFATGAGMDAGGSYTALVLLNADDETALRNARLLRARIDEGASLIGEQPFRNVVHEVEIIAEGRLVLATLRTGEQRLWFALPAVKDTLLLHE